MEITKQNRIVVFFAASAVSRRPCLVWFRFPSGEYCCYYAFLRNDGKRQRRERRTTSTRFFETTTTTTNDENDETRDFHPPSKPQKRNREVETTTARRSFLETTEFPKAKQIKTTMSEWDERLKTTMSEWDEGLAEVRIDARLVQLRERLKRMYEWSEWDEGLAEVRIDARLVQLRVGATVIAFPEAARILASALAHHPTIQEVDMRSNKIGDTGAVAIAGCIKTNRSIQTLDLSWNSIGKEGAQALAFALAHHPTIQAVDMGSNKIGDTGAVAIAECMKTNRSILILYLTSNFIGKEGGIALADALSQNGHLKKLCLSNNHLGCDALTAIATAGLTHNSTLTYLNVDRNLRSMSCGDDYSRRKLEHQDTFSSIGKIYIKVLKTSNKTLQELHFFDISFWDGPFDVGDGEDLQRFQRERVKENVKKHYWWMEFYTFMNRFGRHSFHTIPAKVWPLVLGSMMTFVKERVTSQNLKRMDLFLDSVEISAEQRRYMENRNSSGLLSSPSSSSTVTEEGEFFWWQQRDGEERFNNKQIRIMELNLLYYLIHTYTTTLIAGYPLKMKRKTKSTRMMTMKKKDGTDRTTTKL